MSHKRIIGLIVLGCLFLLVLPFLSSEHEIKEAPVADREIVVPEVKTNKEVIKEITIEKYEEVEPATPPAKLGEDSALTAPPIEPVTTLSDKPPEPESETKPVVKPVSNEKKTGWFVQIASLKQSDPIKIESLKSSLRKLKVKIVTEPVTVNGIKFIRIQTTTLPDKKSAIKEKDKINKNLAYDKIKAIVKKR